MIKDILIKKSKGELEEDKKNYLKFVLCKVDEQEFLIDILSVKEIVNISEITPIPGVSENIIGVLNLRGLVVPIIKINFEDSMSKIRLTELSRFVICEIEKEYLGLFVDDAQFLIDIDEEVFNRSEKFEEGKIFLKSVENEGKKYNILNLKQVFDDYKIKNQE